MNRPPEKFKPIPAAQLQAFAAACFKAAGLRADHADQLAELLTNSDLRGVRSHGTRQVPGYSRALRDKRVNPNPQLQVVQETDTTVLVEGDGGLGYAPMMMATELAIAKAKAKGVALGAARHLGHYGSAGHYVRRAMAAGCTAFSVQGHHPSWFGEGGGNKGQQSAYWGNPPICFGLPSQEEPPLVLDAATCIMADYQRGPQFDALQELIPAAFFKSMGYTGVAMALGGTFVGMSNPRAAALNEQWPGARQGGLIIVMDIGVFASPEEVRAGVDLLVRGVRETMAPVRGYQEATLPGTIEFRKEQEYRKKGIPVALEDLESLEKAGQEFGVRPGWL
ncbi:MAG: Ldh family oxidoreductase [Candidatus Latescibacteria bacterium]|nr:Ldh family oxidoreductase [Candidatus Latescibacterota bacterium]